MAAQLLKFLAEVRPSLEVGGVRPWADAIASGYQQKFKAELQNVIGEMKKRGISTGMTDADIDPPQGQDADGIRGIADKLVTAAVSLDSQDKFEVLSGD
ncbi:MAG: hypothetical protein ABSC64_17920 [Candidatus Korobacteraceae bacterium]